MFGHHNLPGTHFSRLETNEIRVLSLKRKQGDSQHHGSKPQLIANLGFELSFINISLQTPSHPDFVALSYVWGDAESPVAIQVEGCGTIQITRNLYNILVCLDTEHECPSRLWVDAMCINQEDLAERASQVSIMNQIYSSASHVLVFLSTTSQPFQIGLRFLEETAANPEAHYEPMLEPHNKVIDPFGNRRTFDARSQELRDSLVRIFAAPWWTRVWTVQEFALAQSVVFRCGSSILSGKTLMGAFYSLYTHERGCCWAARRLDDDGNISNLVREPSAVNGGLSIFQGMLRLSYLDVFQRPEVYASRGLLSALSLYRQRDSSDPRDRIFGILGLPSTEPELREAIKIDYTVEVVDLLRKFALLVVKHSRNLDILSHIAEASTGRKRVEGLPTWAPDWTAKVEDSLHYMYTERIQYSGLYHAMCPHRADWQLADPNTILTKALFLGKVSQIAPGYPREGSKVNGKQLLEVWRSLFDLGPVPLEDDDWDWTSREVDFLIAITGGMTHSFWKEDSGAQREAYKVWCRWFVKEDTKTLSSEAKADARAFDDHVQQATIARLMVMTDTGELGFASKAAKVGDVVVLMPGGRVPYILRKADRQIATDRGLESFEVLGDAFILNVMHQERAKDEETIIWQEILLV